jgi:hypothetical protein
MSDPTGTAPEPAPVVRRKNTVAAWIVAIFVWFIVWVASYLAVFTVLTFFIVFLLGLTANAVFYANLGLSHVIGMYAAYVVAKRVWLTATN